MPVPLSPQEFVRKWSKSSLKESAAAQEHFINLCELVDHPTPAAEDHAGDSFTFEKQVSKLSGGSGRADVWKKDYFAWEYKGKDGSLDKAYQQLCQYREFLGNPKLLVVSDIDRIQVHTNFTNTVHQVVTIELDDILTPQGLQHLRDIFYHPDRFVSPQTPEEVTAEAAAKFARLAEVLRAKGYEAHEVAHFLIRLLFCLFAEDICLLPEGLFTRLAVNTRNDPGGFEQQLRLLFGAMAVGGWFGPDRIRHFDGGLFEDDGTLALDNECLAIIAEVGALDWSGIEPSVFGTLFERSLDPDKRAQLGIQYTSKDDILCVVEPVLMTPLRHRWHDIQQQAGELACQRDGAGNKATRTKYHNELILLLRGFVEEVSHVRVLDPACGSGNFLYVALKLLLDLQKEVLVYAGGLEATSPFPTASPAQLHGIEKNEYAFELAQATIWIGYIQWLRDNGFGIPTEPILKPVDTIQHMDAIISFDGEAVSEPQWPLVDVIVGNPPFLGGKRLRTELGDKYVEDLFLLYEGQVPREADLVCYWFEKARKAIAHGEAGRAGLLATQGIRGGANRRVLERIKQSGDIFWAHSDRDWILDGAAVHVSMVGFDNGSEQSRSLDGNPVGTINADLTSGLDVTVARRLPENSAIAFMGDTKGGSFDITEETALRMLDSPPNPNGRPNADVVRPWVNAQDITGRPQRRYAIDFGTDMSLEEASLYHEPFEYVRFIVKSERDKSGTTREEWWLHERPRIAMRKAIEPLPRYIVTPAVAKHRLFVWMGPPTLPDHALFVFARSDDYFFGILHSRVHEVWARRKGTQVREVESGFRYTATTTFETFPLPWAPGKEPKGDTRVASIAEAARELTEKRNASLNPATASSTTFGSRTLTKLYNQRPTWLDLAHRKLDEAVLDAYGWPRDPGEQEILERLLKLNHERSAQRLL